MDLQNPVLCRRYSFIYTYSSSVSKLHPAITFCRINVSIKHFKGCTSWYKMVQIVAFQVL